jgi:hypothetical protein
MGVIPDGLEPYLTANQVATFHRDGYLVVPDFFDEPTCQALLDRAKHLLATFSLDSHPMTAFKTGGENEEHVGDDYFLESGDKTRFFFEVGRVCLELLGCRAGLTGRRALAGGSARGRRQDVQGRRHQGDEHQQDWTW